MPAMQFQVAAPPHVIAGFSVPRVMFQVLLALVPFAVVHVWLFGPALLLQRNPPRQPVDGIHIGHARLVDQAPCVGRYRLEIAALRLSEDSAKGQ